jgi:hypothetical protein
MAFGRMSSVIHVGFAMATLPAGVYDLLSLSWARSHLETEYSV